MSQESWKIETDETEYQTPETPILCANNCGFFGSSVTNNLCSKCYRNFIMKQQAMVAPVVPLVEKSHSVASSSIAVDPCSDFCNEKGVIHPMTVEGEEVEDLMNKKPANRCFLCRKKVGLTGFKCRCGETYCSVHRYADTHKCNFDYKSAGREAIAKENPVVKAEKIEKI